MNAQRLLTLLLGALLVGWAMTQWPVDATPSDGAPSEGELAPFRPDLLSPWQEIARIPAEQLARGGIIDLDERGDTLYVLQSDGWFRAIGGELSDRFGSPAKGSPTWLGSAIAIKAVPGGVFIMDRVRGVISRWSADGIRGVEHDFRARTGRGALMEGLSVGADGMLLVSVRHILENGDGDWLVLRGQLAASAFDTIYRGSKAVAEAEAHNAPKLAARPDGGYLLMPALEWRMLSLDAAGAVSGDITRQAGPRWAVSDSIRRNFARLLERLPPRQRLAHALPATLPPVRAVTIDPNGRILVLVASGIQTMHVELLAASGEPIGRLWAEAETLSVFLANGAAFRVRESADHTTIERLRPLRTQD